MPSLQSRPKIKLLLTPTDKWLEAAAWLLLFASWILAAFHYGELPAQVPVHFNASGMPDRYGSREAIFLLPAIGSLLLAGLTALNKLPHIFNYPVTITIENAASQYQLATRFIRYVKVYIMIIFLLIEHNMIAAAHGHKEGLGAWFLPAILLFTILPVMALVISMYRKAVQKK